jgi:hypothetical protein
VRRWKATRPATALTVNGPRTDFQAGELEVRNATSNKTVKQGGAIRAELIGDDTCAALGITARAHAPVTALCFLRRF